MKSKIALILIFVVMFFSCSQYKKVDKQERDELIEGLIKPDGQSIILVSIKYDFEIDKLERIFEEYIKKTSDAYAIITQEEGYNFINQKKRSMENVKKTIIELSSKYRISKELLVNLIIDYRKINCGNKGI